MKHEDNDFEIETSDTWLITYSDMITIVLCFFIIFFSLTAKEVSMLNEATKELSEQVTSLDKENKDLKNQKQELKKNLESLKEIVGNKDDEIKKKLDTNMANVEIIENERGILIRFKDSILFDSASAEISQDGYDVLNRIAESINSIDNKIVVEGFTDNIPIKTSKYPSNWELSVARAISVVKFFTDENGISQDRVSVSGYGELNPIDSNNTEAGRANNRRIEITILNE